MQFCGNILCGDQGGGRPVGIGATRSRFMEVVLLATIQSGFKYLTMQPSAEAWQRSFEERHEDNNNRELFYTTPAKHQ